MPSSKNPAGNNKTKSQPDINDYRYDSEKRKNIPPAKIAGEGTVPLLPKIQYHYSPRRHPVLQFDTDGKPDIIPELLQKAKTQALSDEEIAILNEALQNQQPWLEWAGKKEQHDKGFFEVDPLALHIHERVSAKAILKVAARQDITRDLFADPQQAYHEAVQFYRHDIDWTNRMILGDSLQVMSSLSRREELAGKVQMIYIDPPYGIKFASNFQPEINKRDVKDREQDLTREPEMVKAYRDTWHLGVHSYLTYLRDRLIVAKELLTDSGSIFVQISDENVHKVRDILDEIFGDENFISLVNFRTAMTKPTTLMNNITDFLLWYSIDKKEIKYNPVYIMSDSEEGFRTQQLEASAVQTKYEFSFQNINYNPRNGWRLSESSLQRLAKSERIYASGTLRFMRFHKDFPHYQMDNIWTEQLSEQNKKYAVQTSEKVIQRCLLMTTDPGDLVLDPTCGSGTSASVAENWGRRWITIDTSRVALSIARQRLLTSKFDYYELKDDEKGISGGFKCKTVPHVTLKSIAQNTNLDPIFAKHEPILDERLKDCNENLSNVANAVRDKLKMKLRLKEKNEGKRSITDADNRRWILPDKGKGWEHWDVPFDTDEDYPPELKKAVEAYRKAWQDKMAEVNNCIASNADMEELVDQPEIVKKVVRVSGPFSVEAVQPPELTLGDAQITTISSKGKFDGEPEEMEDTFAVREVEITAEMQNVEAYLEGMLRKLKIDGVRFPNNKQMKFTRLDLLHTIEPGIHAEGRWVLEGEKDDDVEGRAFVGIAFGPQYGPVTAKMVEDVVRSANRLGYDDLVIAGFSFDGASQSNIEEIQHPHLRIHAAHISNDANPGMEGLLKDQPGSQLFTVFGLPRTVLTPPDKNNEYRIIMEGVDIYDPVKNVIQPTNADKVAAWFIDSDYDGYTFCITQAFFPDRSSWKKLEKALKGVVDEEAFEALSGTESLPFPAGKNKCVAVKIIDPRGNEVMRTHKLEVNDV